MSGFKITAGETFKEEVGLSFPVGYGLSLEHMVELGLYISSPRSVKEADHPLFESGLFLVNSEGKVHIADISNAPFSRPSLRTNYFN